MTSILLLNGPNLNLLGTREPDIYGATTLAELEELCRGWGEALDLSVSCAQSNHEGELVDQLQAARTTHAGVIVNAGAFTHTSVALLDAIKGIALPTIEVHMSNIHSREEFRHHSYIAQAAIGVVAGFGIDSYRLALDAMARHLSSASGNAGA